MYVQLLLFAGLLSSVFGDYWSIRDDLIAEENSQMLGGDVILTEKEEIVNEFLMKHKLKEYDNGFNDPKLFSPGRHFFNSRPAIEESEVFKFIKKVPKGGALHGHDTAILSFDKLFNFTYEENLYACTVNGKLSLKFMLEGGEIGGCKWELVKDLRQTYPNYDEWLKSKMTLVTENPSEEYEDITEVWGAFDDIFGVVSPMIRYRPVFEKYLYQSYVEMYEDNLSYLEVRGSIPGIYELDGYVYDPIEAITIYKNVIEEFKSVHPDFIDVRFIHASSRNIDNETFTNNVQIIKEVENVYPGFVLGMDLVGQEDPGKPLTEFVSVIQNVSSNMNFIFHAAETNWFGETTDLNLVDAIMLGTKRIGHGYGLIKHPLLMNLAKERGIALEVCPISNQVLMLVEDMRNHPGAHLIATGYPIVISFDDPSFWGSKALSHDFYMAFMGMASRNADLKLIKKLAENSITYSALPDLEKPSAKQKWLKKWDEFINSMYYQIKYT